MSLVKKLMPAQQASLEPSTHAAADCTYDIVTDEEGRKFLQIDTYDSKTRQILGKKSQSLRFSPEAIEQLKQIISESGF